MPVSTAVVIIVPGLLLLSLAVAGLVEMIPNNVEGIGVSVEERNV